MGVRSRLASGFISMAKVFGGPAPAAMQRGEEAAGMTPANPFSPGEPIGPYDGYSRTPRTHDFVTGYNIAARPRSHERVSFETLKGLVDAYDVAQVAIWHRIDSIRSLDWSLIAAEHYSDDVTDVIPIGMAALKKPDRDTPFETWLGEWLYGVLAYDAAPLYRMRNRVGKPVGLRALDGTLIAPLQDYWGNIPQAPSEAYVQYANGLPWNWLSRNDIIYTPFRKRPNSLYGFPPMESILLNANTDLRFQAYFLQRFCYDEQTEILTRDGWKRFPDVRGDEEFATRSATGDFEWQASKDGKLHVFDSGGTMVEFRNRYVDLLVTPNHRMLTRRKRQGKGLLKTGRDWEYDWHIRRADEFLGRCTVDWRLPLTSSWAAPRRVPERFTRTVPTSDPLGRSATTKVDMPMWAFARFLGVFIAEGHLRHDKPGRVQRYEINVAQMAGGKLDEVRRILKDTGLSWSYYSDARTGRFSVGCKALWTYLEQCGRGAANKVLPAEVMDWPQELLEHLIDGLMIGDGTVNPSGLRTYITTSRRLADQVQEIWQKCGVYSSVATRPPHPASFSKREQYHVRSRRETEFQMPTPAAVPYDGNVYCVAVPNGIVLVRRNGKTMWCGNTEGNIPAAFASAPETWTPNQVEQFQAYWDAFMLGDQAVKSQIKWMPGGSSIFWANEHDFSDHFSLFLLRKTAAAFHVVPSDLGLTENVNRSSGESQADVQHRVGDLPLIKYVQGILTSFLQDDLGLPLRFAFDLGEEQADRKDQAEADKIYVEMGAIGPSDVREMRYGLPEPDGQPVPRFIYTTRAGPIPLASLKAVAGQVDPATAAPVPGSELPEMVFGGAEGVAPVPPIKTVPLAEQIYGPSAVPPAPPPQPPAQFDVNGHLTKDAAPAVTQGITAATGIHSYDLVGHNPAEDEEVDDGQDADRAELVKRELRAFRSFKGQRRRKGVWHDFEFRHVSAVRAHRLNDAGRLAVRKAAGEVAVAGLAVRAADTGRVLMIQRALDDTDPAGGTLEFPGGHVEDGESPLEGAWREWAEEVGRIPPPGERTGEWTSPDGVYRGFVWTVSSESSVPVNGDREQITNPDDPDSDAIEAILWIDPALLVGNPAVRPELLADLDVVLAAIAPHADVAKAGGGPKGRTAGDAPGHWPAWHIDQRLAADYSQHIRQALSTVLDEATARRIAAAWLGAPVQGQPAQVWLQAAEPALAEQIREALRSVLTPLWTTGWAVGTTSAFAVMQGKSRVVWSKYSPVAKAQGGQPAVPLGPIVDPSMMVYDQQSLQDWLDHYGIDSISSISQTRMDDLAGLLETALENGDSPDSLSADIEALGADASMADMIAGTEVARATSQAALASYEQAGVGYVEWLTASGACTLCESNQAAGPIRLGDSFPSGTDSAPAHPHCRCATTPSEVGGVSLPSIADLKDILGGFD